MFGYDLNTNKRDDTSAIGLLEYTRKESIYTQPSFINQENMQSGITTTYQNDHFVLDIHIINVKARGKVFISTFIHSDTEQGNRTLDVY